MNATVSNDKKPAHRCIKLSFLSIISAGIVFIVYINSYASRLRGARPIVDYEHNVCIMTKVRSLAEFTTCNFIEWVEYHLALGVDHIFVSDECSPEPHFASVLKYYSSLGVMETPTVGRDCINYVPSETLTLKRIFGEVAKDRCNWVTAIDMDEYINIMSDHDANKSAPSRHLNIPIDSSLPTVLRELEHPFVRMAWWVVGSDNHETRPVGLTIDNYKLGNLMVGAIKSLAKSSELREYSYQHNPYVHKKDRHKILFGNMTREAYVTHTGLFPDEYVAKSLPRCEQSVPAAHPDHYNSCNTSSSTARVPVNVPANRLFLKHYMYMSFEEYSAQRAAYNATASAQVNSWAVRPHETWLSGGSRGGTYVHLLNAEFTRHMSAKVKKAIEARIQATRNVNDSRNIFDVCMKYWSPAVVMS